MPGAARRFLSNHENPRGKFPQLKNSPQATIPKRYSTRDQIRSNHTKTTLLRILIKIISFSTEDDGLIFPINSITHPAKKQSPLPTNSERALFPSITEISSSYHPEPCKNERTTNSVDCVRSEVPPIPLTARNALMAASILLPPLCFACMKVRPAFTRSSNPNPELS